MQAAGTEELYLNDLIEAAGGKRAAAAQALYHVLVLATRNQAKVAQEMTYGPILLSIYD
ncbi:hypothetical protein HMI56_000418 [Coelomomyces lativittatus]|nr:hypothetical protein HMI56_000418 [Coelomomyces lativittatus]